MTAEPMTHAASPSEAPPAPVIGLRDVSLSFEEKQVLRGVTFEVAPAGTAVLLGVSGSGKSVLLKLILGLLKPDEGEILIESENIVPLREGELNAHRRRMGIVFQEGALFDSLSVYENVSYRLREEGKADESEIERRVREVLGFVELEEAIDKMPAQLSGGMRRRVAIARALISHPSIMLYDSPTAGLDPVTAHTIDTLMAKLRDVHHVTSIVVTHRIQDALMLSNFVFDPEQAGLVPAAAARDGGRNAAELTQFLVLKDGKIHFRGSRQEFLSAQDPYLRRFTA
ncbi:MAG TPA: ATP-binding cassette domain-containing protein [Terriglobia bacterium]|nr:ATP-binding cassette domain-containing protein [Terriglobia bacterium]